MKGLSQSVVPPVSMSFTCAPAMRPFISSPAGGRRPPLESVTVTPSKHAAEGPSYASMVCWNTPAAARKTVAAVALAVASPAWRARWGALVGFHGLGLGV